MKNKCVPGLHAPNTIVSLLSTNEQGNELQSSYSKAPLKKGKKKPPLKSDFDSLFALFPNQVT